MRRYLYYVEIRTPGSVVFGHRLMRQTREQARESVRNLKHFDREHGTQGRFVILRSTVGSGADLVRVR